MNIEELSAEILRVVDSAETGLRQMNDDETSKPVLAGGWSRRQVMGHLIDSACNNHQRFVRASLQGSLEFPGYDQTSWSRVQAPEAADWFVLVALWASYNRYLSHIIARLPADKLDAPVRIGQDEPITLHYLAEDYLRHMLHHLAQIASVAEKP